MKKLLLVITVGLAIGACSSGKKTGSQESISGKKSPSKIVIEDVTTEAQEVNKDDNDYFNQDKYVVTKLVDQKELMTSWEIVAMYAQPKASADSLKEVLLKFSDDEISGNSPCSIIRSRYELNGDHIRIAKAYAGDLYRTCNMRDKESVFMDLFEHKVKRIKIEGNRLLLLDEAGNRVFLFKKSARQN